MFKIQIFIRVNLCMLIVINTTNHCDHRMAALESLDNTPIVVNIQILMLEDTINTRIYSIQLFLSAFISNISRTKICHPMIILLNISLLKYEEKRSHSVVISHTSGNTAVGQFFRD